VDSRRWIFGAEGFIEASGPSAQRGFNFDGLVCILSVIPAKAGIQCSQALKNSWTPFFNGVTTFYEIINFD
jgi:hypothetical protein